MGKNIEEAATDILVTSNDILKAVSDVFPELAGKGIEYYIQYLMADAIVGLVFAAIGFSLMAIGFVLFAKITDDQYDDLNLVRAIIGTIALIGGLIIFTVNLSSSLPKLIAPEGYLISKVITSVK